MRPAVAAAVRLRSRWPLPMGAAVAVLGWHRIDVEGGALAVPPAVFARQLAFLDEHRRQLPVGDLDQLSSAPPAGQLRARRIALTFDDAWADNHAHALGPLSRHRLPATLYVPSQLLGHPGYMTAAQLLEMDAGGVTIGAHSRTHPDLRACSRSELESEIRGSKEDLEDLVGKPVTSFAYPTGLLDGRVVDMVRSSGFTTAVTTRPGWWRPSAEALLIPRSFVQDFSAATFRGAARGGLNILGPLDAVKRMAAGGGAP